MTQLRRLTQTQIENILEKHKLWLDKKPGGERADFSYAALGCIDFSGKDLREANLAHACLCEAILNKAILSKADLRGACLRGALFIEANLREADFREAILNRSDFTEANLCYANFSYADISEADLSKTRLCGANFLRAYLSETNLIFVALDCFNIYIQKEQTLINYEYHSNENWKDFRDHEIEEMGAHWLNFWNRNKAIIFAAMDSLKS